MLKMLFAVGFGLLVYRACSSLTNAAADCNEKLIRMRRLNADNPSWNEKAYYDACFTSRL